MYSIANSLDDLQDWDVLFHHIWNFFEDRNDFVNRFRYWIWDMFNHWDHNRFWNLNGYGHWIWFGNRYCFRHMNNIRLGYLLIDQKKKIKKN
jgi:hypothetical protein